MRLSETQEHVLTLLGLGNALKHYRYRSPTDTGGFRWSTRKGDAVRRSTMLALRGRGLVTWGRRRRASRCRLPARVTLTPAGRAALKAMEEDQ